jgi:hypothetical protein
MQGGRIYGIVKGKERRVLEKKVKERKPQPERKNLETGQEKNEKIR